MNYLNLTLPSVAENLALDEALLLEAEADRSSEILRFWEWPKPAVILGAGGRLMDDVNQVACRSDAVAIFRRSSGGGTVLLGQGCLCYSLILSYDRHPALREIHSSFRFILGRVRDALASLSPGSGVRSQESGVRGQESEVRSQESGVRSQGSEARGRGSCLLSSDSCPLTPDSCLELAGTSDLAIAGRKCSGNSQQRKRRFLLHHGTILYAFDAKLVDRYLLMPTRQPDYRRQRNHGEFLTNLPAGSSDLQSRLLTAWSATLQFDKWPREAVRQLAEDKYGRSEWIRRR